ncbi:MAG: DUF1592 domain-containing protein [Planctomycetales bacterium]
MPGKSGITDRGPDVPRRPPAGLRRARVTVSRSARRWFAAIGLAALSPGVAWLMGGTEAAFGPARARGADGQPATSNDAIAGASFETHVQPFLAKYCFDCHGPKVQREGVAFHGFADAKSAIAARDLWERTADMLRFDAMPPAEHKLRPSEDERNAVVRWIEARVLPIDCTQTDDPGRETIRRLNRVEYDNTVRDLVGVQVRPGRDFPSDDVGEGFDNIGDVLSLSPLLFEKYLDAAEKIAAAAIGAKPPQPFVERYHAEDLDITQGGQREGSFVVLTTKGEAYTTSTFATDGEYVLRAGAAADQAGPEKAKMSFVVDGKTLSTVEVTGDPEEWAKYETAKFSATKGKHRISAEFINDYYNPKAEKYKDRDRNLHVRYLEIERDDSKKEKAVPESHQRIVFVEPREGVSVKDAAGQIVRRFATRAFRRPATDEEVGRYVELTERAMATGETFEGGVRLAVQAVLVSPHFLFRVEADAKPDDPRAVRALTDYELASRLSYFLWSTMPDDELFSLAAGGELRLPKVLEAQVRRMLTDPKAAALAENFGGQWLNLKRLDDLSPDPGVVRGFGTQLREDMRRETTLFFEEVVREDRPIGEFLTADYTFLNARLAQHYGVEGVRGEEFRKVSLEGQNRAGVLTHASVLALTSNPKRTSPVKRGKWILENMLGGAPPDPPPGIPDLEETQKAHDGATLRQQLEIHRANPNCASCHVTMDAIGFGFENFDVLGRWRTMDGQNPVDASGELPSGEKFAGPIELVAILGKRQADFSRCVTEKMLVYALGRGLRPYDQCTVDEIVARLERDGGQFSSLVLGIVHSDPFLKRRGDGGQP